MMSTHTGLGAAAVAGVPGISGGAGDASGVGDGSSGCQHRNSSMSIDAELENGRNAASQGIKTIVSEHSKNHHSK